MNQLNQMQFNPNEYLVSRNESKTVKAGNFKKKGDFNSTFTLYIAYNQDAQMFDKSIGKKTEVNGYNFYSKFEGMPEDDFPEIFARYNKLLLSHAQKNMKYALLYFNLNRGNRINKFWEIHQEALKMPYDSRFGVKNLQLAFYNQNGNLVRGLGNALNYLPTIQTQNISRTILDRYYNDLANFQDRGVTETHRKIIYAYYEHCYLLMNPTNPPKTVETTSQKFEETPVILPKVQNEPLVKQPEKLKDVLKKIEPLPEEIYDSKFIAEKQRQAEEMQKLMNDNKL